MWFFTIYIEIEGKCGRIIRGGGGGGKGYVGPLSNYLGGPPHPPAPPLPTPMLRTGAQTMLYLSLRIIIWKDPQFPSWLLSESPPPFPQKNAYKKDDYVVKYSDLIEPLSPNVIFPHRNMVYQKILYGYFFLRKGTNQNGAEQRDFTEWIAL